MFRKVQQDKKGEKLQEEKQHQQRFNKGISILDESPEI